jgi:hypothetical protein
MYRDFANVRGVITGVSRFSFVSLTYVRYPCARDYDIHVLGKDKERDEERPTPTPTLPDKGLVVDPTILYAIPCALFCRSDLLWLLIFDLDLDLLLCVRRCCVTVCTRTRICTSDVQLGYITYNWTGPHWVSSDSEYGRVRRGVGMGWGGVGWWMDL